MPGLPMCDRSQIEGVLVATSNVQLQNHVVGGLNVYICDYTVCIDMGYVQV